MSIDVAGFPDYGHIVAGIFVILAVVFSNLTAQPGGAINQAF